MWMTTVFLPTSLDGQNDNTGSALSKSTTFEEVCRFEHPDEDSGTVSKDVSELGEHVYNDKEIYPNRSQSKRKKLEADVHQVVAIADRVTLRRDIPKARTKDRNTQKAMMHKVLFYMTGMSGCRKTTKSSTCRLLSGLRKVTT